MARESDRIETACVFIEQAMMLLDAAGMDVEAASLAMVLDRLRPLREATPLPGDPASRA